MSNNLTKKISILLIYVYFLLFLLSSTIPTFISVYNSSVSLLVEFIIMVLIFVLNLKKILKDHVTVALLIFSVLLGLLSVFLTHGGEGSILNLIRFLLGITVFSIVEPTKKHQKHLKLLCVILWLYCLILSPFIWSLYKEGDAFYNPNTIGDALFFTSTILIHFVCSKRKFYIFGIIFLTLGGILLSQCRSALVAEILYLLFLYVPFLRKLVNKIRMTALYGVTIYGVIFPIIFTKLLSGSNLSLTLTYSEKGLYTGREIIWGQMLKLLDDSRDGYLLGLGTKNIVSSGYMVSNYHNWYLGVLYTFGIPVFILYFLIVIRAAKKIVSYDMFCAFLGIMILGFFETVGLFGLTQPYFYIVLLADKCNGKAE